MARSTVSLLLRTTAISALVLALHPGTVLAQRVGVNSAVNPDATGAPPGAAARRLVLGQDVVFNERINTQAAGQTQILFVDESSMSIGPNSDLTIDQFVYDPNSGTGKLAMSATRGVLRFVGGKLSKQDNAVSMRTPTATIAVRGGAFLASLQANGELEVVFIYGDGVSVTGLSGAFELLRRPGWAVTVAGPGAAPSQPFPVPSQRLAALLAQLDGRSGGNGGAPQTPTDATVAASGISNTLSNNITTSVQIANQNQVATTGQAPQVNVANLQTSNQVQNGAIGTGFNGGAGTGNFGAGGYSGVYKTGYFPDQTSPQNMVLTNANLANGTFSATVGPNPQASSTSTTTTASSTRGNQLSFPANTGTNTFSSAGTSPDGTLTGTSFVAPDGSYVYANAQANTTFQPVFVSAGTPVPSSVLAPTGQTRIQAFDIASAPSPSGPIPFLLNDDGFGGQASVSPVYLVAPATTAIGDASGSASARTGQASLGISGTGSSQFSTLAVQTGTVRTLQNGGQPIITGVMRGVTTETPTGAGSETYYSATSSVVDANHASIYGRTGISGFTLDQTQYQIGQNGMATTPVASGAVENEGVSSSPLTETYGFAQPAVATTLPQGVGASRTTQTLNGYFGGQMYTTATGAVYPVTGTATFQTDAANNTVNAAFTSDPITSTAAGGVQNLNLNFGGAQSAFVDNQTFVAAENPGANQTVGGATAQNPLLYLASAGAAAPPTSLLPAGASYCQCQYLQWGYWGGDLTTTDPNGAPRVDHAHINFWAAGPQTPQVDLNNLAAQNFTGTYTGHAIGSVANAGSTYIAAGGFQGTYNFGTHNASFAISNFDGRNFGGSGTVPLQNGQYQFAINQNGVNGAIKGGFFGPNAAETGGNFGIQIPGQSYSATGVFAGKR